MSGAEQNFLMTGLARLKDVRAHRDKFASEALTTRV
jgi:hypothetical protein